MADISKMFDVYHQHLNLLKELKMTVRTEDYICPLCLDGFSKDDINLLSLEDAPQEQLGGKKIAITCKHCNNTCGHTIDFNLINYIDIYERKQFLAGSDRKIKITDLGIGEPINAFLEIRDNNEKVLQIHRNYYKSPNHRERLSLLVKDKMIMVHDKPTKTDTRKVSAAIIKNAYIILFSKTGYTFLLDDYYNRIRMNIKDPDNNSLLNGLWKPIKETNCDDGVYLSRNKLFRGFYVIFTVSRIHNYRFITYIPSPLVDFERAVEAFRELKTDEGLLWKKIGDESLLYNEYEIKSLKEWTYTWE